MKYTSIFFDLDGTLTDPAQGITGSIRYAMEQVGMEPWSREQLLCFIGPPLLDSCREIFHMDEAQSQAILENFRVYFDRQGWLENILFDGVAEMLSALQSKGATLVLATSKPEPFARRILEHFGLSQYFTVIAGSTMDESRVKKADVIAYALEQLPDIDLTKAIMIGDREHDAKGGQANGMDTIGVLFGYGDRPELEAAKVQYIAETMEDLSQYLQQ